MWAERVLHDEHSGDYAKGLRLSWWSDHRRLGVQFLRDIVSNHDPVIGKNLELGADILQRELDDALLPLGKTCPLDASAENRKLQQNPELRKRQSLLMHRAELIQREFIKALEPVAFRHLALLGEMAQIVALEFDGVFNPQRSALLNKMLVSSDRRVRILAATAAARSRNERLAVELRRALLDSDEQLAHAALAALQSIRPPGFMRLLAEAYESSSLGTGRSAAPDPLKRQIVFAAAEISDPAALELIYSAYLGKSHRDAALARWSAEILARRDPRRMISRFLSGLESEDPLVVRASIAAVRLLHSTQARTSLERLLHSECPETRQDAAVALQVIGGN